MNDGTADPQVVIGIDPAHPGADASITARLHRLPDGSIVLADVRADIPGLDARGPPPAG